MMHSTVQSQPFRPGTQSTYQPKVAFPYVQAPGPGSPPPPLLLAVWMDDWNAIHGIIEDAKEHTREWWTKLQIPLKPDFVPGGGTSASISGTGQIGGVGTQHDWQTGTIGRSQWDVGSGKLKGHDIQQSGPDSAYTFIATSGGGVHRVGNEWSPLWQVVNERGPNKETAFHLAARLGRHEIALYLLQHGAEMRVRDRSGWTGLYSTLPYLKTHPSLTLAAVESYSNEGERDLHFRLRELGNVLANLPDFRMTISFEFTTWMPFITRLLPKDSVVLTKRGSALQVDSTVAGFNTRRMSWKRGNLSFLLVPTHSGAPEKAKMPMELWILDHITKRKASLTLPDVWDRRWKREGHTGADITLPRLRKQETAEATDPESVAPSGMEEFHISARTTEGADTGSNIGAIRGRPLGALSHVGDSELPDPSKPNHGYTYPAIGDVHTFPPGLEEYMLDLRHLAMHMLSSGWPNVESWSKNPPIVAQMFEARKGRARRALSALTEGLSRVLTAPLSSFRKKKKEKAAAAAAARAEAGAAGDASLSASDVNVAMGGRGSTTEAVGPSEVGVAPTFLPGGVPSSVPGAESAASGGSHEEEAFPTTTHAPVTEKVGQFTGYMYEVSDVRVAVESRGPMVKGAVESWEQEQKELVRLKKEGRMQEAQVASAQGGMGGFAGFPYAASVGGDRPEPLQGLSTYPITGSSAATATGLSSSELEGGASFGGFSASGGVQPGGPTMVSDQGQQEGPESARFHPSILQAAAASGASAPWSSSLDQVRSSLGESHMHLPFLAGRIPGRRTSRLVSRLVSTIATEEAVEEPTELESPTTATSPTSTSNAPITTSTTSTSTAEVHATGVTAPRTRSGTGVAPGFGTGSYENASAAIVPPPPTVSVPGVLYADEVGAVKKVPAPIIGQEVAGDVHALLPKGKVIRYHVLVPAWGEVHWILECGSFVPGFSAATDTVPVSMRIDYYPLPQRFIEYLRNPELPPPEAEEGVDEAEWTKIRVLPPIRTRRQVGGWSETMGVPGIAVVSLLYHSGGGIGSDVGVGTSAEVSESGVRGDEATGAQSESIGAIDVDTRTMGLGTGSTSLPWWRRGNVGTRTQTGVRTTTGTTSGIEPRNVGSTTLAGTTATSSDLSTRPSTSLPSSVTLPTSKSPHREEHLRIWLAFVSSTGTPPLQEGGPVDLAETGANPIEIAAAEQIAKRRASTATSADAFPPSMEDLPPTVLLTRSIQEYTEGPVHPSTSPAPLVGISKPPSSAASLTADFRGEDFQSPLSAAPDETRAGSRIGAEEGAIDTGKGRESMDSGEWQDEFEESKLGSTEAIRHYVHRLLRSSRRRMPQTPPGAATLGTMAPGAEATRISSPMYAHGAETEASIFDDRPFEDIAGGFDSPHAQSMFLSPRATGEQPLAGEHVVTQEIGSEAVEPEEKQAMIGLLAHLSGTRITGKKKKDTGIYGSKAQNKALKDHPLRDAIPPTCNLASVAFKDYFFVSPQRVRQMYKLAETELPDATSRVFITPPPNMRLLRTLKGKVTICPNFPLTLDQLWPLIDCLSSSTRHFQSIQSFLKDSFASTPGVPIALSIPLMGGIKLYLHVRIPTAELLPPSTASTQASFGGSYGTAASDGGNIQGGGSKAPDLLLNPHLLGEYSDVSPMLALDAFFDMIGET